MLHPCQATGKLKQATTFEFVIFTAIILIILPGAFIHSSSNFQIAFRNQYHVQKVNHYKILALLYILITWFMYIIINDYSKLL